MSLAVAEAGAALTEEWRAAPPEKLEFLESMATPA